MHEHVLLNKNDCHCGYYIGRCIALAREQCRGDYINLLTAIRDKKR